MNYETYTEETDSIISLLRVVECLEYATYRGHADESIYHNTSEHGSSKC